MNNYEKIMFKRYGERYAQYRQAYKSENINPRLDFPLEIDLDLIDACNIKCPACHTIGRARTKQTIDKETLKSIISECNKYDMPAVNIGGGGEPLLAMDLTCYALKEIENTSIMDKFMHTNGLLMSAENSKIIIEAGITFLCVSIDAASKDVFRKMRGADYDTLIENIGKFLVIRGTRELPFLRVSFLETSVNIHEKKEFIKLWKDKADIVDIQRYIKTYDSQPDGLITDKNNKESHLSPTKKRMAIVAPKYLCESCNGVDVEKAIIKNTTLSEYGTIKKYWDSLNCS
jgi:molybdenum cofactor biosynthesis enzyme MoaA